MRRAEGWSERACVCLGLGGGARAALDQGSVDGGVEEAGVRVSVHQRVDLQLRVLKGVGCGVGHLLVDDLPHP